MIFCLSSYRIEEIKVAELYFFDIWSLPLSELEKRLSYLGFRIIPPSPALRPYVESYWLMESQSPLRDYREEFMHPQGGYGIIFNLGDVPLLDKQVLEAPVFLDGANNQSRKMAFIGKVALLGIRFKVGGAYPFLGIPLAELSNQTALMEILGEAAVMPLYEAIANVPLREQIRLIEAWLLQRLARGKDADRLVWDSLALIRRGVPSMDALSNRLNMSQRQIERLYQLQVGLSPKYYSRLLRIDAARRALKEPTHSLTDLGLSLGFYDQSHFIREFKTVIGMTPSAYVEHSLLATSL
jgi:AraC-like DNA-binding protein